MKIENKMTKKVYRKLLLQELLFGSKSSLFILVFYILLWKVTYTITKIGQLKTNIPLFLGISILILCVLTYIFITYRKQMKKKFLYEDGFRFELNSTELITSGDSRDQHVFSLLSLVKVKKTKKWYLLTFQDGTFLPVSKDNEQFQEVVQDYKPVRSTIWHGMVALFILTTIVGGYYVGTNAVNLNGKLAWKINELKTDTHLKLKNDNLYEAKLDGILESIEAEMEMEPYLSTNDLEIAFEKDGTISRIYSYIYGFDQDKRLQSGYLLSMEEKDNKLTVHKQDWHGEGTKTYDPDNDLSIVAKMLNFIPIEKEVNGWNEDHFAILYKGIRDWGYNLDGIRFIYENGEIATPITVSKEITGPSVSLYVPGKEEVITPKRYIYEKIEESF